MDKNKELITNEEWAEYMEDCFSQVEFCLPKKEDFGKFLEWREKNNASKKSN